MSDHSTPQSVMARLERIDEDLAERANAYEQAAGDRTRLIRDWEYRMAVARTAAKGPDADARKAAALVAAASHKDKGEVEGLYDRLKAVEASYEAQKVVVRLLETRSAIGMSVLKAQGRG